MEEELEDRPYFLFNLLLTIVIFSTNEIGRMLGLSEYPLAISAVWPATGFSLAGLLLLGTRVAPAIFIGNFIYNFQYLYPAASSIFSGAFLAGLVSTGSLLQALFGFYMMRRYSSRTYLKTIKDMVVFLLFGGLITCLIACTFGTLALWMNGNLQMFSDIMRTWTTFWVGDTMGVYIFTPPIIVWALIQPKATTKKYFWEAFSIGIIFIGLSYLILFRKFPLFPIYYPLIAWITYRFGLHGGTLAIFAIGLPLIISTTLGHGVYSINPPGNALMYIVISLEVLVFIELFVAGIVNELENSWRLLQERTEDLQVVVASQGRELKQINSKIFIKDRLNALGLLNSKIAKYIQFPLDRIQTYLETMDETLKKLAECFKPDTDLDCQKKFTFLENGLKNILKYQSQALRIANVIEDQAFLASPGNIEVKFLDVNDLVNTALLDVEEKVHQKYPNFDFNITESYAMPSANLILVFPEELKHAIVLLLSGAIHSMQEKKDLQGDTYKSTLDVKTINEIDKIEIIIKDNGMGVSSARLLNFFQPFVSPISGEEVIYDPIGGTGLGLYLANEIIRHLFQGEIDVETEEGEFLQFKIILPKPQ